MESLERLKALHDDLNAHAAQSLLDLDRLWETLSDSIGDFKLLLDNVNITADEQKRYRNGEVIVQGQGYAINEEFRNLSNAIGVALDIPEEHASRLIIESQSAVSDNVQVTINDVVRKYHDRRDFLLQDLRLILEQVQLVDLDPMMREKYNECLSEIIGRQVPTETFAQRCMQAMIKIEARQAQLSDQIQSKAILGQARGEEFYRTLEFQRSSLFKQHEALGAIVAHLFKSGRSFVEDLRKLHEMSLKWQRLDFHWVHYLPAFGFAFDLYGSQDGGATSQDALQLNHLLSPTYKDGKFIESQSAIYRPLAATLDLWWTARYSSFYRDNAAADSSASVRDKIMKRALDDGGLEFMLFICTNMKKDPWLQSARQELVDLLLDGSNISFEGVEPTSTYFYLLVMQVYENFAECWITNMPDSIRELKKEEDDRRLVQITATTEGALQRPSREDSVRLHLEAFLVLIAFAFEGRPDEAEQFWEDPDSNLYGFVQWASRRQTVPRASAFCEMLCAISELSVNAHAAHKFLLEDTVVVPALRNKKMPSMSYQQIFAELEFYSRKVHEKTQINTLVKQRQQMEPELNELESPIMLSCYLRLLSHLCKQGTDTRDYVLGSPDFEFGRSLLALSSGSIPTYLRANIFLFFEALLTDKTAKTSDLIWSCIDEWAATTHDRAKTVDKQQPSSSLQSLQNTLAAISSSYDQHDAFVRLLIALIQPLPKDAGLPLSFPAELGTNYRSPGITPYVDFVCGQLTLKNTESWYEYGSSTGAIRTSNAFEFILVCLTTFNEAAIITINKTSALSHTEGNHYINYAQRHPFARVIQWIFSSTLIPTFMALVHQPLDVVAEALPDDPRVVSLVTLIDVLNQVIDLQPTFFDVLRPKLKANDGYKTVQFSGITAIEDITFSNPDILLDMCRYATTEHVQLALTSLSFLERLSQSAKFQHHLFDETQRSRSGRQMVDLIGTAGEIQLKHVSASLAVHLALDARALEFGSECDDYRLKDGLLSFLNACLATHSQSPNIAHLLLGFDRVGNRLVFTADFESGTSMFDSLAALSVLLPSGIQSQFESWLTHIKAEALCALKHLWTFPVSTDLTLTQLRRADFLSTQLQYEMPISRESLWNGISIVDQDFFLLLASEAFTDFLSYRRHLYDYITREIQCVAKENVVALQERYISTLQGKSISPDRISVNHATIFDLFDFAEFDLVENYYLPDLPLQYFNNIDFSAYMKHGMYDMAQVELLIDEVTASITTEHDATRQSLDIDVLLGEANFVSMTLRGRNRLALAKVERLACLRAYVDMIVVCIQSLPMDRDIKTQFITQTLQLVMPKLDMYLSEEATEAVPLTILADTLLYELLTFENDGQNKSATSATQTRSDLAISEKLFQIFRICAEGVPLSMRDPDLRASLYSVCTQYVAHVMSRDKDSIGTQRACSNAMDTVRSIGPQLVSIVSDDADEGLDTCRTNALGLLSQLVSLAYSQKSNLIIEAFVKSNILEVLLDPIKVISAEFQSTDPSNRAHLTTLFEARIHLLLQVSRARTGAMALLDANLLQTLRDSMLFAADPDLGLDLNAVDPSTLVRMADSINTKHPPRSSLATYFTLLALLLRLLLSTFLSVGPENEKMIYLVRSFLQDYRGNMVGIFKRAAGLNLATQQNTQSFLGGSVLTGPEREMRKYVDECVTSYTGLAIGSDFMVFEQERGLGGNGIANSSLSKSIYSGGGFT